MTTPSSAPRSAVAQAIALLSHYGFDTKPYTAAERVGHWLDDYEANWIRFAIIEALYQGRYKSISVEHILSMWVRRGQPSQHFNGDFERIICRKLPAGFKAAVLNPIEPSQATESVVTVTPEVQSKTSEAAIATEARVPENNGQIEPGQAEQNQTERHNRRRRVLGIQQWRWLAQQGTIAYGDGLIRRLKVIAVILPSQLEAEELPIAAIAVQPALATEARIAQATSNHAPVAPITANAANPAAIVIDVDGIDVDGIDVDEIAVAPADPTPHQTPTAPTLELPRTEPPPLQVRSGIRTFCPRLRISPFFIRLKAFRCAIIWMPVMAPAALPPATESRQPHTTRLATPQSTVSHPTAQDPTAPATTVDHPEAADPSAVMSSLPVEPGHTESGDGTVAATLLQSF
ncbi:MAG: hypothetical protein AAGG51_25375 [Cyanobacteria bacterium P01_G01_bin.54]